MDHKDISLHCTTIASCEFLNDLVVIESFHNRHHVRSYAHSGGRECPAAYQALLYSPGNGGIGGEDHGEAAYRAHAGARSPSAPVYCYRDGRGEETDRGGGEGG